MHIKNESGLTALDISAAKNDLITFELIHSHPKVNIRKKLLICSIRE